MDEEAAAALLPAWEEEPVNLSWSQFHEFLAPLIVLSTNCPPARAILLQFAWQALMSAEPAPMRTVTSMTQASSRQCPEGSVPLSGLALA